MPSASMESLKAAAEKDAREHLWRAPSPSELGPLEAWLFQATRNRNAELMRALISSGADVHALDESRSGLAIRSAYAGDAHCLGILIEAGCDIHARDAESGWTPATSAAAWGNTECLALLVAAGAGIEARDAQGWTPAMHAASGGAPSCSECLLLLADAGCDLDALSNHGVGFDVLAKDSHKAALAEARSRRERAAIAEGLRPGSASPQIARL